MSVLPQGATGEDLTKKYFVRSYLRETVVDAGWPPNWNPRNFANRCHPNEFSENNKNNKDGCKILAIPPPWGGGAQFPALWN